MNFMLAKKLDELDAVADELRVAFASEAAAARKQLDEKEALQQELWRVQKDLAALKRLAEDNDNLAETNERYQRQRERVRQGLERILRDAKALGLEYQE